MNERRDVVLRCGPALSFGGDGIATIDDKTVFVRGAAPGELVRARMAGKRRGHLLFDVEEVLEASRDRREAPCRHYGECGGCQLQHLEKAAQLEAKRSILAHALGVAAGSIEVRAGAELRYRSRVRLHARAREVGYRRRRSHEVLAFEECKILVPELERAILDYGIRLRDVQVGAPSTAEIELVAGDEAIASWPPIPGFSIDEVAVTVGDFVLFAAGSAFFQANRALLSEFVDSVVGLAGDGGARVLDLYCGAGLFSLPLSRVFDEVIAVDGSERAFELARRAKDVNQVGNVDFRLYDAATWLQAFAGRVERGSDAMPDVVVLDPPRVGAKGLMPTLRDLGPERVVYVSCDPQTLARDLDVLRRDGLYALTSTMLFDLFPQTFHLESVVCLQRVPSATT